MSIKNMLAIEPDTVPLSKQIDLDWEYLLPFLESVNNAIWLVDANLRLVAQNRVAGEIVGWSSEAVGRSICDLFPSGNGVSCELHELLSQTLEKQQPHPFDKDILLATKNNQRILVGGKISPVVRQRQTVGAVCAFWKVTPELGNKYLRFEFADMASHLLRTPLSIIQTSIDLLINAKLDADERQAMLIRMRKQNQRLKVFVNELLKMLRLETEGMQASVESVALLPLIERVLNLVRYEQPHHVFNLAATDTLPMVKVDPTKTELILLNLLLSAVRRCPEGGHITVVSEQNTVEVIISVVDDGESIPEKLLDRAFLQFYPVDDGGGKMPSTYQLGLYTTKKFVELQKGRIWAESWPGQGSKFSFSMPVWEKSQ